LLTLPSILFGALFTLALAWMLGNLCLAPLAVPQVIALAVGAAVESSIVFALLVGGVATRPSFIVLGVVCAGVFAWLRRTAPRLADPATTNADRVTAWLLGAVLAFYAALYLVNALAPELEPDAIAYHLGLTREYVRLGAFPHRVTFYEILPQGLEMLFVPAYAFGRHSAARLVHCAFLLATVPLMRRIGRRLALPDGVSLAAAALYLCAPMVGITGTSAYTDAGGVFFTLAAFYLLLVWRDTRDARYLVPAGITAGFCYAVKLPGALVVVLAIAFVVAVERAVRLRSLALLVGAALLVTSPWILRSAIVTGNPVAPMFNRLFPNPYFHPAMDKDLAATFSSWRGVPAWRVPYEIIVGGAFQGTTGLVFFALPLGLLALRRRAGRLCWLAGALLALPWFWNTGARFLMPALPFLALALAMALEMISPRRALWACLALQAVACWPQVISLYHPAYTWRLQRIPWRAALRIQPERDYLTTLLPDYHVARLVEDHTNPGERVFSLITTPTAYTDREVLGFWHSAQADQLSDALFAAMSPGTNLYAIRADWTLRLLWGLRIRAPRASAAEWQIHDVLLFSGDYHIFSSPQWSLHSWPNSWELHLAFDDNPATRWRSWQSVRAGMYVEVDFDRPQLLSAAVVTSSSDLALDFYGREQDGWQLLACRPTITPKPLGDVRMAATRAIRAAGFRYILAADGPEGNGILGAAMARDPADWGLEKVGDVGPVLLFRIR